MDLIISVTIIGALTAAFIFAWRRIAGPSRTTLRRTARVAACVAASVVLVGVAVYELSSSRTFQVAGPLVPRVETDEKLVALTLDDGPTAEYTEEVLAILDAQGIPATFYLTGRECEESPDSLKAIVDAGHEIGNHTYSHQRMVFLGMEEIAEELQSTDALFQSAGYSAETTFRPPGCKRLFALPVYLDRSGRTTVTWDLEPDSGPLANDAEGMTKQVAEQVRPGSIILMHAMYDSREPSRKALPKMIEQLKADGYRFVTVSTLLAAEGPAD